MSLASLDRAVEHLKEHVHDKVVIISFFVCVYLVVYTKHGFVPVPGRHFPHRSRFGTVCQSNPQLYVL